MASMEAYRKAASKLSPRLSPATLSKIGNDMEQALTGAPSSAFSIPESVRRDPFALSKDSDPGAVIRSIGTSRRVFLLHSALSPVEIDGLAYRLRALSSNDAINSVVVANPLEDADCDGDMSENETCLPSFMEEGEIVTSIRTEMGGPWGKNRDNFEKSILDEEYGEGLGMPYVSSGYDAKKIYEMGLHKDPAALERELMQPLVNLSEAVRGSFAETSDNTRSKVPVISVTNGLTTDAGYALLSGSYALATQNTSFRILNPLRGLAFDPVGLSYLLPRVGFEFGQASAEHSKGCALLLALAGFEANATDLVSTGLATHYIGGPYKLNMLERGLSELNSWECQSLQPKPKRLYGQENRDMGPDINQQYKNVAVGNLIQYLTEYDAAGADEYGCYLKSELDDEHQLFLKDKDPSLTLAEERIQMYGEVISPLVNWAATFGGVWQEDSVHGMMERLREIAAKKTEYQGRAGYEEDAMVADQAEYFVTSMEQRSPLALSVMHELLLRSSSPGETLKSCMEREKASQMRLFTKADGDYARWAQSGQGVGLVGMQGCSSLIRVKDGVFDGWNHKSVKEVTDDEVKEIVGI
ncbi:predicted protein [Thalassiosira pseudonana CCMP1335]|jgi:enoyl-CoA hydratase/carnithine racemase|uniref:3-hydroxyisobutyryl-CoA hydrolase n=1 Tax=Thalassiosira pseudonana TaxID=35128 RepID=B8CAF1_THAPS|nr:predicted protein [Thalassiosira pseudonana CCMP1335]EED89668.1 predicted protein [Thalassiosira pseudonana CCMP1335]|eukprot:scaffold73_cov195-Alexandrium_tamarense.AAC.7